MAEGQGQRELRKAYLLMKDVGKEVDVFRQRIGAHNAATNDGPPDVGSFIKAMRSKMSLGRNRQDLLRSLDMAGTAIDSAEKQDPGTRIDVEEGEMTVTAARAVVMRLRGSVEFVGGRVQAAVEHYKQSIDAMEFPDTEFLLACAYEAANQPDLAVVAYDRCAALAADEETEVDAQKAAARIRARMLFGGWFVGSWKIFGALTFFAAAGVFAVLAGGGAQAIPGTLIFVVLAGSYGWWKFRRPTSGEVPAQPELGA